MAAINKAFQGDRVVGIFAQKNVKKTEPNEKDLYEVGTIATISQMMSTDGEIHAVVRGQVRVKIKKVISNSPFMTAEVVEIEDKDSSSASTKALASKLAELFKKSINLGKQAEIMTVMKLVSGKVDPVELVDQIAALLDIKTQEKQKILEIVSLKERMEVVHELLSREVNVLDIERSIQTKTQKRFEDQMRKAMLREKKKTIEKELGEQESELDSEEMSGYKKKIKEAKMPKEVLKKARKELKGFLNYPPKIQKEDISEIIWTGFVICPGQSCHQMIFR